MGIIVGGMDSAVVVLGCNIAVVLEVVKKNMLFVPAEEIINLLVDFLVVVAVEEDPSFGKGVAVKVLLVKVNCTVTVPVADYVKVVDCFNVMVEDSNFEKVF